MDEKLSALLKMGQLQTAVTALFFQAEATKASGDYELARPIYEDYVSRSLAYLQVALKFNRKFSESPWDIRPIVQRRTLCAGKPWIFPRRTWAARAAPRRSVLWRAL